MLVYERSISAVMKPWNYIISSASIAIEEQYLRSKILDYTYYLSISNMPIDVHETSVSWCYCGCWGAHAFCIQIKYSSRVVIYFWNLTCHMPLLCMRWWWILSIEREKCCCQNTKNCISCACKILVVVVYYKSCWSLRYTAHLLLWWSRSFLYG